MVPPQDSRQTPPPLVPLHPAFVLPRSLSDPISENPRSAPNPPSSSLPSSDSPPPPPPPPPNPSPPPSSSAAIHPGQQPVVPSKPPLPASTSTSSRPASSSRPSPANFPSGQPSQLHQPSYAQVARGPRGPGFVRSHASEVEHFARLPRTGTKIICGSREGMPSFSFVNSDLPKVEELYSKALVMKFLGGRPSLESSHKEISSWGIVHSFTIGPLTSRAFLLRFQEESDLLKVLTRPSSTLITFPYKIYRWHNLCHLKEDSCLAPVWISLPRLPLQCFIPEFLESVANKIGRFLCLDKATATLARPSVARLCVELDLRKPPPTFIWVGLFEGFKQPIVYEKLPKFCTGCNVQGHSNVQCSKAPLDNPQPSVIPLNQAFQNSTPSDRQNAEANKALSNGPHQPPSTSRPHPTCISNPLSLAREVELPDTVPPLNHIPGIPGTSTTSQPSIQHNLSSASALKHKQKQPRKAVEFRNPQLNLEANQEFWEAMNRQVTTLEQARLKAPSVDAGSSPITIPAFEDQAQQTAQEGLQINDESESGSSIAADSQPNSPQSGTQDNHNPDVSHKPSFYDSEGEEPMTNPSPFLGHSTDDLLSLRPKSSKRNKRHPDQPLKVQLRVRKDPNPSS